MKRRHLVLEGKSNEDEKTRGSFQRNLAAEDSTEKANNERTQNKSTEKFIDWQHKCYDVCIERDVCFHKHAELDKTRKMETENTAKVIKSHLDEKKEPSMKIDETLTEKEKCFDSCCKTEKEVTKTREENELEMEKLNSSIDKKMDAIRKLKCD